MKILLIHGAFSTYRSFNYIRNEIEPACLESPNFNGFAYLYYDISEPMDLILERVVRLTDYFNDGNFIVIGHSLGGLIAADISQKCNKVAHCITIAAPFGGVTPFVGGEIATNLSFYYSKYLMQIRNSPFLCPVTSFVTTKDNVVPIHSQKCRSQINYIEYPLNHFECLLDPDITSKIRQIITWKLRFCKETF